LIAFEIEKAAFNGAAFASVFASVYLRKSVAGLATAISSPIRTWLHIPRRALCRSSRSRLRIFMFHPKAAQQLELLVVFIR
jgi:hypothetical protein